MLRMICAGFATLSGLGALLVLSAEMASLAGLGGAYSDVDVWAGGGLFGAGLTGLLLSTSVWSLADA